jgi:hypothetical protein
MATECVGNRWRVIAYEKVDIDTTIDDRNSIQRTIESRGGFGCRSLSATSDHYKQACS